MPVIMAQIPTKISTHRVMLVQKKKKKKKNTLVQAIWKRSQSDRRVRPTTGEDIDFNYESWDLGHPWSVRLRRPRAFLAVYFPLPICRGKIGPARDAVGGTRWRTRERRRPARFERGGGGGGGRWGRREEGGRKKGDRSDHTWQCTTKAWWMRGRLVYVIGTWSPANGVVRLSAEFLGQLSLSFRGEAGSFLASFPLFPATRECSTRAHTNAFSKAHPCHCSDRSCCHILRTRPYCYTEREALCSLTLGVLRAFYAAFTSHERKVKLRKARSIRCFLPSMFSTLLDF